MSGMKLADDRDRPTVTGHRHWPVPGGPTRRFVRPLAPWLILLACAGGFASCADGAGDALLPPAVTPAGMAPEPGQGVEGSVEPAEVRPPRATVPARHDPAHGAARLEVFDGTISAVEGRGLVATTAHRANLRTVGTIVNEPEALQGYTLFSRNTGNDEPRSVIESQKIYLIDNAGRVVHRWDTISNHARLQANGNLLAGDRWEKPGNPARAGLRELAPNGEVVWEYVHPNVHHDFVRLPNGNVVFLSSEDRTVEEAVAAGADPVLMRALEDRLEDILTDCEDGDLECRRNHPINADPRLAVTDGFVLKVDYIVEVEPTGPTGGDIVWEWRMWDHLVQDVDPDKPNYGVVAEHPELIDINYLLPALAGAFRPYDWTHANSLDYNPELDQLMLSPRHFSELWIIDHSTTLEEARGHVGGNSGKGGDILYRWGNPRAYGAGTTADQRLFWQHDPQWIGPGLPGAGNILVFNNGSEFGILGPLRPGHSSVVEIVPPVSGYGYRQNPAGVAYGPAEPVWIYAAEPPGDFFAGFTSGAQRLPNGNTFITDGPHGRLFEVTPEGRTVWEYVNPVSDSGAVRQGEVPAESTNRVYRAYRYAPGHPGLRRLNVPAPIEQYSAR